MTPTPPGPARTPADRSDPDVAIVLDAYAAFARGDAEAAVAAMDPAVEWIEPLEFLNGGRRVGPEAVAEYLAASRAVWKHLTSEPTAYRLGGEIVVVHRLQGILADGTANEATATDAFRLLGGRVVQMRAYAEPEEAFAAAPVRAWIDAYVEAWNSNDPAQIAALFTADASYWSEPWEGWHGREAIVAGWLEHADQPGEWTFEWTHGGRGDDPWVIEARTGYPRLGRDYMNLWLLRLDGEGRASWFSEWWKQIPDDAGGSGARP
jgi:ketosteroid isomerase-like protein